VPPVRVKNDAKSHRKVTPVTSGFSPTEGLSLPLTFSHFFSPKWLDFVDETGISEKSQSDNRDLAKKGNIANQQGYAPH
jgi:hypothetical protein